MFKVPTDNLTPKGYMFKVIKDDNYMLKHSLNHTNIYDDYESDLYDEPKHIGFISLNDNQKLDGISYIKTFTHECHEIYNDGKFIESTLFTYDFDKIIMITICSGPLKVNYTPDMKIISYNDSILSDEVKSVNKSSNININKVNRKKYTDLKIITSH